MWIGRSPKFYILFWKKKIIFFKINLFSLKKISLLLTIRECQCLIQNNKYFKLIIDLLVARLQLTSESMGGYGAQPPQNRLSSSFIINNPLLAPRLGQAPAPYLKPSPTKSQIRHCSHLFKLEDICQKITQRNSICGPFHLFYQCYCLNFTSSCKQRLIPGYAHQFN